MTETGLYQQLHIGRTRELTGERILSYQEALTVIGYLLGKENFIILGIDVLNTNDEYLYAFWSYEADRSLSPAENTQSSCQKALAYISSLKHKEKCNYIFVLASN